MEFGTVPPCVAQSDLHTITYRVKDPTELGTVPYFVHQDNHNTAVELIENWLRSPPIYMRSIKLFRNGFSDSPCFFWENVYEIPNDQPRTRHPEIPPKDGYSSLTPRERKQIKVLSAIVIILVIINLWMWLS